MKKISETFLEFVSPLLSMMPPGEAETENTLKVGFTVWNSMVYDQVNGNSAYLDRLRSLTSSDPAVHLLVSLLIKRKQELFANDERLIGDYKVTRRHGHFTLRAEARDPRSRVDPNND